MLLKRLPLLILLVFWAAASLGEPETVDMLERVKQDRDADTVVDSLDNCPEIFNPDQEDFDLDGTGDACDNDIDGDNVPNWEDNAPYVPNPGQEDLDGDGKGDVVDHDIDGDGVENGLDNCLRRANPDQADTDGDGIGDVCDEDIDGDGIRNAFDALPADAANELIPGTGGRLGVNYTGLTIRAGAEPSSVRTDARAQDPRWSRDETAPANRRRPETTPTPLPQKEPGVMNRAMKLLRNAAGTLVR
ncbi:thrombospondin type 3 repeat-containing protein [bacterium]|nr:thrombospondin type 3 repeat-containing protein [bacterium]